MATSRKKQTLEHLFMFLIGLVILGVCWIGTTLEIPCLFIFIILGFVLGGVMTLVNFFWTIGCLLGWIFEGDEIIDYSSNNPPSQYPK